MKLSPQIGIFICLNFIFLNYSSPVKCSVQPVNCGESLWCITKRIGQETDQLQSVANSIFSEPVAIEAELTSCCTLVNSKLDLLIASCTSNLVPIQSGFNQINSSLSTIQSNLDICCSQLNGQLNNLIAGGLGDVFPTLQSCCSQLNSKLDSIISTNSISGIGSLQSGLDTIISLVSKTDNDLLSCCSQVNSKLDTIIASSSTSGIAAL